MQDLFYYREIWGLWRKESQLFCGDWLIIPLSGDYITYQKNDHIETQNISSEYFSIFHF